MGENATGLTERLAQRVSRVLGGTPSEDKEIRRRFKDLYKIRSRLVHGDQVPKYVQADQLRNAREFARLIMLWFLRWLDEVVSKAAGDPGRLSERRDLLHFLDLEATSRNHIKWLAESMPPDFPRVLSRL